MVSSDMVRVTELRRLLCDLKSRPIPPQPSDDSRFEAWAVLVEIEASIVGMIQSVLASGPVDRPELRSIEEELGEISEGRDLGEWKDDLTDALHAFRIYL